MQQVRITKKHQEIADTVIVQVKPVTEQIVPFLPGQYVFIKNPKFSNQHEAHPFSIASSPKNKEYLEFCIKIVGDWTKEFEKLQQGDRLEISNPTGAFTWDEQINDAVFLLGGIGISPMMSMLRFIKDTQQKTTLHMLYGNRTPKTIAYKNELSLLQKEIDLRVVDVFSHLTNNHPWQRYRGFITEEVIKKEVDLSKNPMFFVVGPPVFIAKMNTLLKNLSIPNANIKQEKLEEKIIK